MRHTDHTLLVSPEDALKALSLCHGVRQWQLLLDPVSREAICRDFWEASVKYKTRKREPDPSYEEYVDRMSALSAKYSFGGSFDKERSKNENESL